MNTITNLDLFVIDGNNFSGIGRGELKCTNQYNYKTSPGRQNDFSMTNLNAYDSAVIPQVEIGFKLITIEDFYILRQLLLSKRNFNMVYFDVDFNHFVAHEMYPQPDELKAFFNRGESIIGVQGFKITMVGTLNGKDTVITDITNANLKTTDWESYFNSIPSTFTLTCTDKNASGIKWGRSVALPKTLSSGVQYYTYSSGSMYLGSNLPNTSFKFRANDRVTIFGNTTLTAVTSA